MLYRKIEFNGVEYPLAVGQSGKGAPTEQTPGCCGCTYLDTDSGTLYACISDEGNKCRWVAVSGSSNSGDVSDARIAAAVETYLRENPVSGSSVAIGTVDLLASEWAGDNSPYSQVVQIVGVTENTQVDLTPSVEQLAIFHNKDLTFVTENDDGVVTVYAIGQKPENDYTIQVTMTEVSV